MELQEKKYKIVLHGDFCVEGTSFLKLFEEGRNPAHKCARSARSNPSDPRHDHAISKQTISGRDILLELWDTNLMAGRIVPETFYRSVDCFVLIYDLSSRESFQAIPDWKNYVEHFRVNQPECYRVLVGNKSDFKNNRSVSYEEGYRFVEENNFDSFMETSFEYNKVGQLFDNIARALVKRGQSTEPENNWYYNQFFEFKESEEEPVKEPKWYSCF